MNQKQKFVLITIAVLLLLQLVLFTPFILKIGDAFRFEHGNLLDITFIGFNGQE